MRLGVIVLDTLRYDVCSDEMTNLQTRSDHIFSNLYSSARWTPPAHASLFTGYYPTEVGTHAGQRHLTTSKPTIVEKFQTEGYQTIAASNNINVDRFFGFDRGFDTFHRGPGIENRPEEDRGSMDWGDLEKQISDSGIKRPLEAVYHILRSETPTLLTLKTGLEMFLSQNEDSQGIGWSREIFDSIGENQPDDLFFFANFMPCHFPYDPPEGFFDDKPVDMNPVGMTFRDTPVTDEEHERYWAGYTGAARYLDDVLPDLIEKVDWDVLFVVGDHGELFDDHGIYGHQYGVYEELTHVPALAFGSKVPEGKTTAPTSLVDIPRTLLEVAGIEPESDQRGINLFGDVPEGRVVYAESEGCEWFSEDATGIESKIPASWAKPHFMIRTTDGMYVKDKDGEQVFDPESNEPKPSLKESLREQAREIREERFDFSSDNERGEVPQEVQDRLEQLGYR